MDLVKLSGKTAEGVVIEVTFCPEKGMNLLSYKQGSFEIMDRATEILFDQRGAGLGALIGPHFHHRKESLIPPIQDPDLFPHFALLREQGVKEPFSHGIARYVPWKIESRSAKRVKATLSSKSEWRGIPIGKLEGQEFNMIFIATLTAMGLEIEYSVVSDHDAIVGLHYYYALSKNGPNFIEANISENYNDQGVIKKIPESFGFSKESKELKFNLANSCDYGFRPYPKSLAGSIKLVRPDYRLQVLYTSASAENSWQLYHPKGATYVCIEPMSAADPRKPQLTVSGLNVHISVEQ